ncbi:methyltransferase [Saxibacter everestensis]|uniref:Methyltransferase n=1 Tax=Saxibacter everestensis TaxID=2909229 RepID=A0ABY8QTI8_9MICO|nr:methyltransferase [Brevibacteriaceae bacterium ZFBP1038]
MLIDWAENGQQRSSPLLTSGTTKPPTRIEIVNDRLRADVALRLASEGTGMLWRGDFVNARQLLDALKRRLDRIDVKPAETPAVTFHRLRQAKAHRTRILSMLLIEVGPAYQIDLTRAPDVQAACQEVFGDSSGPVLVSLQELLGMIGASEWRRRGVVIPALDARIHPHYGVFAPTRNEYVDLVANAEWPQAEVDRAPATAAEVDRAPVSVSAATTVDTAFEPTTVDTAFEPTTVDTAFDIGTGTGVLAALLVRRGVRHVVATDIEPRAVECARDNMRRLEMANQVEVLQADLYPPGRADLVVCNPPWVPATPTSTLEKGVFDRRSQMLSRLISDLPNHLTEHGECWLVLSDLAERLGLRSREQFIDMLDQAGLSVAGRLHTSPRHPRALDGQDPLASIRAAEVVTLWRLRAKP